MPIWDRRRNPATPSRPSQGLLDRCLDYSHPPDPAEMVKRYGGMPSRNSAIDSSEARAGTGPRMVVTEKRYEKAPRNGADEFLTECMLTCPEH